jgi:polyisoprenoid-binding protein YceI
MIRIRALVVSGGLVAAFMLVPTVLNAQQATLTVDAATSLAWWQIDPNYGHLWATTCPEDPSWQPGEARSNSGRVNVSTRKKTSPSHHSDSRIPIYPRGTVSAVCRLAVAGSITAGDTVTWRNVRGEIRVLGDSLMSGLDLRDRFARKSVLETQKHREIKFMIDSLTNVQTGDTITAIAVGTFELHGVRKPMTAPVRAWREPAGLRVQTQFSFPASELTGEYNMSKLALGMGVTLGRWKTMHMGVDVILRRS